MKLHIPVAVTVPFQLVERIADANPGRPIEDAVLQVLTRGADHPIDTAGISLSGDLLQTLTDLLPLGSTRSAGALVAGVQKLGEIRIGGVKVPFTTAQLDELKERAKRSGRSVQQEVESVVRGMHEQYFNQPIGA